MPAVRIAAIVLFVELCFQFVSGFFATLDYLDGRKGKETYFAFIIILHCVVLAIGIVIGMICLGQYAMEGTVTLFD